MISHHCSEFLRLPLMRRYFLLTPDISGAFVLSSHLAGCLGSGMWPRTVTVSTLDPESSNRGSNPREALCIKTRAFVDARAGRSLGRQDSRWLLEVQHDTEGIRTPAGRAQWISSPSP